VVAVRTTLEESSGWEKPIYPNSGLNASLPCVPLNERGFRRGPWPGRIGVAAAYRLGRAVGSERAFPALMGGSEATL